MDKNQHLSDVLYTHKMQHIQDEVEKFITRKEEIISLLMEKYRRSPTLHLCQVQWLNIPQPTRNLTLTL